MARSYKVLLFSLLVVFILFASAKDVSAGAVCRCEYLIDSSIENFEDQMTFDVEYKANDGGDCEDMSMSTVGDLTYGKCEWAEYLSDGTELGCCEAVYTEQKTGAKLKKFFVDKNKEECVSVCSLGLFTDCLFDSNTPAESCAKKEVEFLGCCESAGQVDKDGKKYTQYEYQHFLTEALCKASEMCAQEDVSCEFYPDKTQKSCKNMGAGTGKILGDEVPSKTSGTAAPSSVGASKPSDVNAFKPPDASGLNQLSSTDVKTVIGGAIKAGIGLMGSIALAMFVYGGVLWMASAGNAERSKKGMQVILWAALGMFMILTSYAIVSFVFSTFQ